MGQLGRLINRIQGPRILIPNLLGSALSENDFELFNKPRDSTGVLQVLPGKRDIKRHTPTILYILLNPLIWQHQRIMAKKSLSQIQRILGECLLISSLPGKALRTLVDIARLAEQFNMRSQSRAW